MRRGGRRVQGEGCVGVWGDVGGILARKIDEKRGQNFLQESDNKYVLNGKLRYWGGISREVLGV